MWKNYTAYTFPSFKSALKASKIICSNIRKSSFGMRETRKAALLSAASLKLNPAREATSQGRCILLLYFFYWLTFKEGGKGENYRRERETSSSCLLYVLRLGAAPTAQACALSRSQARDLLACGTMCDLLSHRGQAGAVDFEVRMARHIQVVL